MKILKSFDTKIDAEELLEATEKYGEWNAILVKKHWVKLLLPLVLVFVSMLLLNSMLYVIYIHLFHDHKVLFRILAIFYVYTCVTWSLYAILWIMTNIIWQIKAKKKYIDDISIAEFKQKSFEKFLKRTFVTFAFHVLVFLFNAIVPFVINENSTRGIAIAVWALILDLVFIVILNRVIYRIIEYEKMVSFHTNRTDFLKRKLWIFLEMLSEWFSILRNELRVHYFSTET